MGLLISPSECIQDLDCSYPEDCCTAGLITTLISPEEEPSMKSIAAELGIDLQEEEAAEAELSDPERDIDSAKKELEDLFNLM